ncbi:MAG: hypothetical protein KAI03_07370 [Candidatus Aureabacteria bacterium]|nr:hypothetical protein [Candidatus Auribacterota bacterium]
MEALLKIVLGAVGLIIVITRGIGLVNPATARKLIASFKNISDSASKIAGISVAVVGFYFIVASAFYSKLPWLYVVALLIGSVMIFAGFVMLYLQMFRHVIEKYIDPLDDKYFRILCAVGVAIGLIVLSVVIFSA